MDQRLSLDPDDVPRAAVLFVLSANGQNSAAGFCVGVVNDVVHLAGSAGSLEIRAAAEEYARNVPGGRGLVNRIDAPGAPSPTRIINLDLGHDPGKANTKDQRGNKQMTKILAKWLRKFHRWIAVPTALAIPVAFIIKMVGDSKQVAVWEKFEKIPSVLMLVMALTGAYLFLLPYIVKWQRKHKASAENNVQLQREIKQL